LVWFLTAQTWMSVPPPIQRIASVDVDDVGVGHRVSPREVWP
jgi:hypothetical protein